MQVRNFDSAQLRDLVYEQWLLSDLSDSSLGCLPVNYDSRKLNGTFLLQVGACTHKLIFYIACPCMKSWYTYSARIIGIMKVRDLLPQNITLKPA